MTRSGCWLAALLLCASTAAAVGDTGRLEVETRSGPIIGAQATFHGITSNGSFYSFQGIPYAAPPVGALRFLPPQPVERWTEPLEAAGEPAAVCLQQEFLDPARMGKISGSEDCLYLNVYSREVPGMPGSPSTPRLSPVLFWIHGGGFAIGSGHMMGSHSGADFMLERGLVVVTINYRLGALGFLALEGSQVTGNQGLRDQLLALRWVKENIAQFGGDPGRITIAGESAGGVSTHAHILSPLGRGEDLFHRAISFSGTMLMGNTMGPENEFSTLRASERLFEQACGEQFVDETEVTESCLYNLSGEQLVKEASAGNPVPGLTLQQQQDQWEAGVKQFYFWPSLDSWAEEPFLPEHPVTTLHNQRQKQVPWMTGVTKDEGALISAPWYKHTDPASNQLAELWGFAAAKSLFGWGERDIQSYPVELEARTLGRFYLGREEVSRDSLGQVADLFTDAYFAYPNTEAVKLHAAGPAPVYNYLFSYHGSASFAPLFARDPEAAKVDWGVGHADDTMYLFKLSWGNFTTINTPEDEKFVGIWQQLVGNFAEFGNPTPLLSTPVVGQDTVLPVWPPAQQSRAACVYLDIGLKPAEKHRMFAERMEFWNKMYFKDVLEKYGISDEDNELMEEIDTAVSAEIEVTEEEEENEEEADIVEVGKRRRFRKGKNFKRRQGKRDGKFKNRKFLKQKRLAKKLRSLKC